MLQEGKSLKHSKLYLSNRNLRDCTFQDQLEHNPHQLGSKLSLIATNNNSLSPQITPNILIGDADTFFLLRENDRYEQQINELIDEMQANHVNQSAVSVQNQQLREELDDLRMKNDRNAVTMNLLHKISEELVVALKVKSKMAIRMANLIKKLESSLENMIKKLQRVTTNKEQIQLKYAALYKQVQIYEEKMKNRSQTEMQTQQISLEHVALQVQNDLILYKQQSTQSQSILHHTQSTETSILTFQKQINTLEIYKKDSSSQTQKVFTSDHSLQFGAATASLLQIAQQTEQVIMNQTATDYEKTVLLQSYTQYQQPYTSLLIESLQIETQTDTIQTKSIPIMTQSIKQQQKNMQTQQQKNLKLYQNQFSCLVNEIPNKSQEQIISKRQLKIVQQVVIQVEQNCRNTFQTQVTEQDRKSIKVGIVDKEVSQNILGYFKQINSNNQISYNEQIVKNLQEKGQTQASKALARLMKQHMCLKLCLNRLMEKQAEQLQSQNEKIIEVFEQSIQNVQQLAQISQLPKSPLKEGSPQKEQCAIY